MSQNKNINFMLVD